MSDIADRVVAVLDANVLYPFAVRDALLRFAEAGLYRAHWSAEILDEWTQNLLRRRPELEDSVRSQLDAIKRAFPEALVEGHENLIPALRLPDDEDRHVLAAAIRADAQIIVTENIADFPPERLAPNNIDALAADRFLSTTFENYPSQAMAALGEMRRAYDRPKMDPGEFILHLKRNGLVELAAMLGADIDSL